MSKYYRIEINIYGDWLGAAISGIGVGSFMSKLGLPLPDNNFDSCCKFWFTKNGWKKFGMALLSKIEECIYFQGYEEVKARVLVSEVLDEQEIQYEDSYQIAVSPDYIKNQKIKEIKVEKVGKLNEGWKKVSEIV